MKDFNIQNRVYFAMSARTDEIEVIKRVKPPRILVSFALWREKYKDKDLYNHLIKRIGYKPESIIIDSGAFSFGNIENGLLELLEVYKEMVEEDGKEFRINEFAWWWFSEFQDAEYYSDKNQFCLFEQYINFLFANRKHYEYCMAFDVMGDNEIGLLTFQIMKSLGLNVIPVFQATTHLKQNTDFTALDHYASETNYIAIGGTAITRVKGYTKKLRIKIVNDILNRYPNHHFHLLGTLDPYIIEACPGLYSIDGQSWLCKVNNPEVKRQQSIKKVLDIMDYINSKQSELTLFNVC